MALLGSIDAGKLLEVVYVSAGAGIIVTLLFSLVVLFGARSAEHQRSGHAAYAIAHGITAAVLMILFAGLVAYGVHVMLTKS